MKIEALGLLYIIGIPLVAILLPFFGLVVFSFWEINPFNWPVAVVTRMFIGYLCIFGLVFVIGYKFDLRLS